VTERRFTLSGARLQAAVASEIFGFPDKAGAASPAAGTTRVDEKFSLMNEQRVTVLNILGIRSHHLGERSNRARPVIPVEPGNGTGAALRLVTGVEEEQTGPWIDAIHLVSVAAAPACRRAPRQSRGHGHHDRLCNVLADINRRARTGRRKARVGDASLRVDEV